MFFFPVRFENILISYKYFFQLNNFQDKSNQIDRFFLDFFSFLERETIKRNVADQFEFIDVLPIHRI